MKEDMPDEVFKFNMLIDIMKALQQHFVSIYTSKARDHGLANVHFIYFVGELVSF